MNKAKAIIATNLDTGEQTVYKSTTKASKVLGINSGQISMCCSGKYGNKSAICKRDNHRYTFDYESLTDLQRIKGSGASSGAPNSGTLVSNLSPKIIEEHEKELDKVARKVSEFNKVAECIRGELDIVTETEIQTVVQTEFEPEIETEPDCSQRENKEVHGELDIVTETEIQTEPEIQPQRENKIGTIPELNENISTIPEEDLNKELVIETEIEPENSVRFNKDSIFFRAKADGLKPLKPQAVGYKPRDDGYKPRDDTIKPYATENPQKFTIPIK